MLVEGLEDRVEDFGGLCVSEELGGLVGASLEVVEIKDDSVTLLDLLGLFFLPSRHVYLAFATVGSGLTLAGSLLGLLLGLVLLLLLSDDFVSLGELFLDFSLGGDFALHPGVTDDVSHRESLMGVQLEHRGHQILEVVGEETLRLVVTVGLPEEVGPVGSQKLVVGVPGVGVRERRVLSIQDEQDDGGGEEINNLTLVGGPRDDFRSHVAEGAQIGLELARSVSALEGCGETEISQSKVEVRIEKHVFRL